MIERKRRMNRLLHDQRREIQINSSLLMIVFAVSLMNLLLPTTIFVIVTAFQQQPYLPQKKTIRKQLPTFFSSKDESNNHPQNNNLFDYDDTNILRERLNKLQIQILEEEIQRPPNSNMSPIQVVQSIMTGLLYPYDPLPYSGFRLLINTATKKWRTAILQSVGAPVTTTDDKNYDDIISALGSSIGRPHNQFAILVGEGEEYVLDFSHSYPLLDYGDGTCWIECHLLDKITKELLVITGWDLCQREEDGAWLVDWIYWQDFRDEFRPGIGRSEWLVEA
jgi:hypothetical protein